MAQIAGWVLILALYFQDEREWGLRKGLALLTVATMATGCGMAIACSSMLAAAYLSMPPRWVTGVRAISILLGLSLLGALRWTTVMTPLVAGGLSIARPSYARWCFFHTSILMTAWSGAFLWFMDSDGPAVVVGVCRRGPPSDPERPVSQTRWLFHDASSTRNDRSAKTRSQSHATC